jgi:RNA polymerase sigma-70 factor (ECF subfamily)
MTTLHSTPDNGPSRLPEAHASDVEPAPFLLRQGDKRSFDLLYYRYAPRVLGLLLHLTRGDRCEAEDLTQETFLASFAAHASYAERGSPLSWLLGIALRRWRDKQRSAKPASLPLSESLPEKRDIERQVVQRAGLDDALDRLEPRYREALLLIAGQQLSYKEAAAIMEEPVGTVKWLFHEATRRMRLLLQNDELTALSPATRVISSHTDTTNETRRDDHEPRNSATQIAGSGNR